MTDNDPKYDLGGNNDIRLPENTCGAVYALNVASNAAIGSDYVAYDMKGLVAGIPTDYTGTALEGNKCDVSSVAEPDNISFLEGGNTLVIGEDTSKHPNDMVWAYDINTGKMQRIATGPFGSEMTNAYWYKDINGFGYLTNTVQHPFGEVSDSYVRPAGVEAKTETGVIGPFDFSKLK
jgi:secreted PhoX family phosphatase